ncbi:hypothetical protein D3C75_480710 [compost metagenome]
MLNRQAGVGEHAALTTDEAEIALRRFLCQQVDHLGTHATNAQAHFGQFGFPLGAQFRAVQHGSDNAGTVGRRVGVVGTDHAFDLRQHARAFFFRFADDRQGTHALAVQRERLGEGAGGEESQARLGKQAYGSGVFVDAIAEALVGHVEERHVAFGFNNFQDVFPVRRAQVHAGRVVAAGVQHDDRAVWQRVQVFQHAGTVHVVGRGVVVTVVLHRETGGFEQRAVVFPARVADRHNGVRQQLLEEVGTDFQCASTANGLGGDYTAGSDQRRVIAEQQLLHGLVVGGDAVDWQVATGNVLSGANGFGFDNGAQEWNSPLLVAVNTDPQVDFVGPGIGVECFVEAQDWIAWCHFDSGEQAHYCGGSEWRVEGRVALQPNALERCTNGELV